MIRDRCPRCNARRDFPHRLRRARCRHARVRRLLADAGFANGIDVTLYADHGTMVNDQQRLEAIADMWSKVGIRAKVEMMEISAWILYGTTKPVGFKPRADYRLICRR
jgi:peptide/nickel transport system substrate-binding protein